MKEIKFYDTRDIYRELRRTVWNGLGIKEKEFSSVVTAVNKRIAEAILDGEIIKLPCGMGSIVPVQEETLLIRDDGKVILNQPIDWKATMKLWEEDPEAKKDRIRVRHDVDKRFKIIYSKKGAYYRNIYYIKFKPIKPLAMKFIERAVDGTISCYLNYG